MKEVGGTIVRAQAAISISMLNAIAYTGDSIAIILHMRPCVEFSDLRSLSYQRRSEAHFLALRYDGVGLTTSRDPRFALNFFAFAQDCVEEKLAFSAS